MREVGEEIHRAVAEGGHDLLLPARLAGTVRFAAAPVVRDQLALPGGALLVVLESGDEVIATPVVPEHGVVRRAVAGDGAFAGLLEAIGRGSAVGRFSARAYGAAPRGRDERAIDVDQSNDSVVVGGAAVVKVYPRVHPGPQPGLDLPAHLAAVGFARTPRPIGALTWTDDAGREALLSTAAAHLPGARDGWDWFVALVLTWLDGGPASGALEAAAVIGELVAGLHRALATPSPVFPDPVAEAGPDVVRAWGERGDALLAEAIEVTGGAEGERLRALEPVAAEALVGLGEFDATPVMRIHGDLHVGQVLRWEGGDAVSDFDGNPLAPAEARTRPDSPARDVASMARAIDHVGRVCARRRPGREGDLDGWIAEARARFLAAYRRGLAEDVGLFDARLLRPFEVIQECHEYVYAARYLPRWLYVPDLAMPALLAAGSSG
ncbi:MAG: phosphotransferase [Planctomycetaceae bacterium]